MHKANGPAKCPGHRTPPAVLPPKTISLFRPFVYLTVKGSSAVREPPLLSAELPLVDDGQNGEDCPRPWKNTFCDVQDASCSRRCRSRRRMSIGARGLSEAIRS